MSYKDYRIKARLADVGKKQVDLLRELRAKGITTDSPELSNMISGVKETPKAQKVLEECHKTLCKWERK